VSGATALNGPVNMRNVKRMAAATNRLRSEVSYLPVALFKL
jgi:hypothetical protein